MTQTQKYVWVIETLRRYGPLSLKELNEEWALVETNLGNPIIRQTFDRWKAGILDMFGVVIGCQLHNGYRYFIENPEVLNDESLQNWILNSFSALQAVADNIHLEKRILVEEVPSSSLRLTDILNALKQNRVIQITYRSFQKTNSCTFLVKPYCVKLFQKRWYLLGHSVYDNTMRLYGVDRIVDIQLTEEIFQLPDNFDPREWFSPYFGIVVDSTLNQERVVLRATKEHRGYLRSLPLHHTQKEIASTDEYSDFEMHLCPTYDFCMEMLKQGIHVEVLEPKSLRHRMHSLIQEMLKMYEDK